MTSYGPDSIWLETSIYYNRYGVNGVYPTTTDFNGCVPEPESTRCDFVFTAKECPSPYLIIKPVNTWAADEPPTTLPPPGSYSVQPALSLGKKFYAAMTMPPILVVRNLQDTSSTPTPTAPPELPTSMLASAPATDSENPFENREMVVIGASLAAGWVFLIILLSTIFCLVNKRRRQKWVSNQTNEGKDQSIGYKPELDGRSRAEMDGHNDAEASRQCVLEMNGTAIVELDAGYRGVEMSNVEVSARADSKRLQHSSSICDPEEKSVRE
ncbi:hypothetical protein DM02DRAFT_689092 [Periconia macrospinosa]|uniref:Uncharacterized protein n=1 Tax=Periconia macrospinosa TaxID=97972 RepID=A0A2V1DCS6_9PLEO|nr:hypothetical protein DM02DRAFT_689092 [Periconia macrospinosa]